MFILASSNLMFLSSDRAQENRKCVRAEMGVEAVRSYALSCKSCVR
ncbi:hypothetical protein PATSB16_30690 [Pandoraea thiooxydans]|nr:hypothetical protein PATSB16_30690 [Pandoraea thiooxydans]